MSKKIILPIVIAALAIFSVSYFSASKPERKKVSIKEKTWQVNVQKVQYETIAPELTVYASVESSHLYSASAAIDSIVTESAIKAGDRVKKGQILMVLDPDKVASNLTQKLSKVDEIKALIKQQQLKNQTDIEQLQLDKDLLQLSKAEYNRLKRLQQKGLGSDSTLTNAQSTFKQQQLSTLNKELEVKQYQAKIQQLNAQLAAAKDSVNQARKVKSDSVVKAAFDGWVSEVKVAQGDRVKLAQTLLSLYPSDQLEVKTRIPFQYQAEIQALIDQGQSISASAELNGQTLKFKLDRLAAVASADGIDAFFKVTYGSEQLRLGNFIKLKIKRLPQKHVLVVPLTSLYGTSHIFVVREERMQSIDVIALGYVKKNNQQMVLLRSDKIKSDDLVITNHMPNAISGLKVKIAKSTIETAKFESAQ